MFVALTWPEEGLIVAFQLLVIVWPEASVNTRLQPLTALEPVLLIVMFSVSPVFHAFTASLTLQAAPPPPEEELDVVGVVGVDELDDTVPPSALRAAL